MIPEGLEVWCERGDSNPHGFPRQILSLVRLPIPPLSHNARGNSGNNAEVNSRQYLTRN